MIVQVLFAFALFSPAFSCNGGVAAGDRIISNPSFEFQFSPPVSWTWYTPNNTAFSYPAQATNQVDALRNMNNSINAAILISAQKLGYSTIGMTWTISGYNPQMMYVIDDAQVAASPNKALYAGTYVPGLGAVLSKRGTYDTVSLTYPKIDYVEKMTINVRTTALYFKSQWETLADRVFNYLSINDRVKFRSPVTIN